MTPATFTQDDVVIEQRETLFQGFYRLDKLHLKHKLFEGGYSKTITRELFVRHHAVGALIYDPKQDSVLLIEQFRVGALTDTYPWQLEIVAGLIKPGEDLEEVARRETEEEAGISLGRVEKVMHFLPSPGGSDEAFTLFVAEADLSVAGGVFGLPEEGEDIRVSVVSREEALNFLTSGRINNAACIIALQWLALNYANLQKKWL